MKDKQVYISWEARITAFVLIGLKIFFEEKRAQLLLCYTISPIKLLLKAVLRSIKFHNFVNKNVWFAVQTIWYVCRHSNLNIKELCELMHQKRIEHVSNY